MPTHYAQFLDDTLFLIEVISQKIPLGMTSHDDCVGCCDLSISTAIVILTAIRDAGYIVIKDSPLNEKDG